MRLGTLKSKVAWPRQHFLPASSAFPSHSPDNVRDLKSKPRCFGGHPSKGATSGNGCGGGLLEALGMPALWFARISMHSDEDKRIVSLHTTTACYEELFFLLQPCLAVRGVKQLRCRECSYTLFVLFFP
jgi:hypothetical protein